MYVFLRGEEIAEDVDESGLSGFWEDYGLPDANSEYKLEKSKLATLWWIPGNRTDK